MQSERIVSCEYIGEMDCVDIEVDSSDHLFFGDGIATSNSHALGYSKLGYWTAYAKYHWTTYFLTAWLSRSSEKINPHKEVEELVSDARMYDIPVLVPDFRDLKTNFYTDGLYIRFGIGNVKTVGQSIINKIMDKIPQIEVTLKKSVRDFTWYDLLFFLLGDINSRSVTSLINSGSFDYFGLARNLMSYEFEKWSELTENEMDWIRIKHLSVPFNTLWEAIESGCKKKKDGGAVTQQPRLEKLANILQLLKKPPYSLQDSPDRIAFEEKELLGTSVTCAKIDACDIGNANTSCKELLQGKDEKYMVVAGEITKVKECLIKKGESKGKSMAFVGISDGVCTVDAVAFNNEYSKYRPLFVEGNTVIVRVERDTKGKKSLIVKAMQQC